MKTEVFDLENPFQEDEKEKEKPKRLFESETEFMPAQGFFQNPETHSLRHIALIRFQHLAETPGFEYDPFVPFLAITYFDRCASRHPLPPEMGYYGLFIITCVVLAWKMRTESFPLQLFLDNNRNRTNGFIISIGEIERMEQRILDALSHRLKSITALCFLDFFISLLDIDDERERRALKVKSTEYYIPFMQYDVEFTWFKPSIIAATGLIAERARNGPMGVFWEPILRCQFVQTDDLDNCINLLTIKMALLVATKINGPSPSPPGSPDSAYNTEGEETKDEEEETEDEETGEEEVATAA